MVAATFRGGGSRSTRYGGTSPHFGKQEDGWRDDRAREKRGYHARLVEMLAGMEAGAHGYEGEVLAAKWLASVRRCPGVTRRHGACGGLSFEGYSCDFALCPWCQARRAERCRNVVARLVDRFQSPKLWTLTVPNVADLTGDTLGQFSKAVTLLLRRKEIAGVVRGGFRSLEVTFGERGWHPHSHVLVDADWVAHYSQTDIAWDGSRWRVTREWDGLARLWTAVCQRFPLLASKRPDFEITNPDCWYFVDLRAADAGAVSEVAKYVSKGNEIVSAGGGRVLEYLAAVKGHRMIQGFGSMYNAIDSDFDLKDDSTAAAEPPEKGCCPWLDCPDRAAVSWQWVCHGLPAGVLAEYEPLTGLSRVLTTGGSFLHSE